MSKETDESRRAFFHAAAAVGGASLIPRAGMQVAAAAAAPAGTRRATGAQRLRELMAGPGFIQAPVFYDMVSLRLCEQMGFPAAFIGGQPVSASMYGMGDYGWLTITELIEFAARAVEVSNGMPVLSDADDGGGNPLNMYRAIRQFEHAGVAGVMIEDLYGAKHVPKVPEGPIQTISGFTDKIKAAVDARKGDMVIVARCDAMGVGESFEKALERLVAYAQAGADMVFMAGAGVRRSSEIAKATGRPVMTTVPPNHDDGAFDVLRDSQVKLAVYAGALMTVAAGAVHDALGELKQTGRIQNYQERALARGEWSKLLDSSEAVEVAKKFNATRWPS